MTNSKRPPRAKRITIDELAAIMMNCFQRLEERFTRIDDRFDQIDDRFQAIDDRFQSVEMKISGVNNRLDDIAWNRATRDELGALDKRVRRCEGKLKLA